MVIMNININIRSGGNFYIKNNLYAPLFSSFQNLTIVCNKSTLRFFIFEFRNIIK